MLIPDDDFKGLFASDDLERAELERVRAAERDVFVRLYLLSVHGTEGTWN